MLRFQANEAKIVGLDLDQGVERVDEVLELTIDNRQGRRVYILSAQPVESVQIEQSFVPLVEVSVLVVIVKEVCVVWIARAGG